MYVPDQPSSNRQQLPAGMPGSLGQREDGTSREVAGDSRPSPPTISLPKGGGAIRGMGEKFSANPVTGTASLSVPIYTSPGRSGFGPQLSLSYDSGTGKTPFGWGWSLSAPSITRKTDKGLPRYRDAEESDIFILSGAEDLVPVLRPDGKRFEDTTTAPGYKIHRYRPRIEGLFARIERWTDIETGEIHWRSITRDNVTTLYGKDNNSRIFDPADPMPARPTRVFSWHICESYDDKGNAIVYEYSAENDENIDRTEANERNRVRIANRYLKRIKYGNRTPNRDATTWQATDPAQLPDDTWMFEVVFDYGEGHYTEDAPDAQGRVFARAQIDPPAGSHWPVRQDPFSTYRAGFEVRTYRLCRRVLMFHHFPNELGTEDYLVRSTDFTYEEDPKASFITGITQSGYLRKNDGIYLKKSLPPLEFEYSQATVHEEVREVDPDSLENLPQGLDGTRYQWLDLDGEGVSGILTEQAGAWFYKRNLSPISTEPRNGKEMATARFGPMETVAQKPSLTGDNGGWQFLDLAGDGSLDFVCLNGTVAGFYERTDGAGWDTFTPFESLPVVDWADPNLKFVDLTGDGLADVLITEGEVFTWHPSLAEAGFGPAERAHQPMDEERGPRLVFADGTQSVYLADFSGDGQTDLVRVRNGEVCYWPNLGYGRFGHKVTMDNSPLFDMPDLFDQRRIRLADIDGSGVTDIIYLGRDGIQLYFNRSGNSWSEARTLDQFPHIDNFSAVTAVDLLGNGTACLVWSSPLPGDARRPMRYVDLMSGQKPHLLVKVANNLGAETYVKYAPSTRFFLADKLAGKPWITKLPFPVHVVEQVETHDRISRNRFVTRYAYHHGYFDGVEREFRGFGMVEQCDTEEFAALSASNAFPDATNLDEASHVPPVLTKTWFHTGVYFEGGRTSKQFENEYYQESDLSEGLQGLTDAQLHTMLLDDTVLPVGLSPDETREACRALKGSILRQEIYALDATEEADRPYSVSERNYTLKRLQPREENRHAVFFVHPQETVDFHYERKLFDVGGRKLADPRVTHAMTLDVDDFGNVLQSVAISYGRRHDDPDPLLTSDDREEQKRTLTTYTENRYTNPLLEEDAYRTPLSCETLTFELLKVKPSSNHTGVTNLFRFEEMRSKAQKAGDGNHDLAYEDVEATGATEDHPYRRLIERVRTLYRRDDLTGPLPLGQVQSLALPFENYKLAFTPGLLSSMYKRKLNKIEEELLPDSVSVLSDEGCYVLSKDHKALGMFPASDPDDNWWIPSGQGFYSPDSNDTFPQELAYARQHFFLPHRFRDPFEQTTMIAYDPYDLLVEETRDPEGNRITAGTRDEDGDLVENGNDYRVLQPGLVMDPNRNRSAVKFDALGLVVGTAVMGKPEENLGDSLDGFESDLAETVVVTHLQNPFASQHSILQRATTRLVYDLSAYWRTQADPQPQPTVVYTLTRETHDADLAVGQQTKIQHSFSYSDGFEREIQKKIQAEPGPLAEDGPNVTPRWLGSGWTIFNNKGKPVRQYEPFFSATHAFEFAKMVGVSLVLFYDPVERVVAILHPNHTYEKAIFDPWWQATWDVNDTVLQADPKNDPDVGDFFRRMPDAEYLPAWHAQRQGGALGTQEENASNKAAAHANTPTVTHFDTLGRAFLTVAHNRFERNGTTIEERYATRVHLDIESNPREVIDAQNRIVMRYDYDMLGNRSHQASMEAGERWILNDVAGKPIYAWDSRGHTLRTVYDTLRRPTELFLREGAGQELLVERTVYGETQPNPETSSLRGQVYQVFDDAGVVTNEPYDFKGNLLRSTRQLRVDYKNQVDWNQNPALENELFVNSARFDALNRMIQQVAPHSNRPGTKFNVIQPTYNEANLLERLDAWLQQLAEPAGLLDAGTASLHAVAKIDYNAKGQRTLIECGNGVQTQYEYDPQTFRLTHLFTTRGAAFPPDCPNPPDPPCGVQNLRYTYDPEGNITHIRDDAQQTVYFRNRRVEPSAEYTYDAIYQLIEATGREHLGQAAGGVTLPPTPTSHTDAPRVGLLHQGDGNAMGCYRQRYVYDKVGNILEMIHRDTDPAHPGWTRMYNYNELSLLEPGKTSNRLTSTQVGSDPPQPYTHDAHGNMTIMPHLPLMGWDYRDQLQATAQQVVNNGGTPEITYYVYDASGQRVRKVTDRQAAAGQSAMRKAERIYLGGLELYREYNGDGSTVTLERETLHVTVHLRHVTAHDPWPLSPTNMPSSVIQVETRRFEPDEEVRRIVLVETRTRGNDDTTAQLIRYQLSNHLGSAVLELNDEASIISYEEYYPFGSTAYQATDSTLSPGAKRYRYTGKERDEESGLYHHGARYCAAWLGRWTSTDPAYLSSGHEPHHWIRAGTNATGSDWHQKRAGTDEDQLRESFPPFPNLYAYVDNNPIAQIDPDGRQSQSPQPLTTTRLRAIAQAQGIGAGLSGIQFNRAVGRAFQDWALRAFPTSPQLQENFRLFRSVAREQATLGRKEGPIPNVMPDAVRAATTVVWERLLGFPRPRLVTQPDSAFVEVKAVKGSITLSHSSHQITGLIDVAANSPAGLAMGPEQPTPAIIFITTGDTTISPTVLAEATRRGVGIWQAVAFELPGSTTAKPLLGLGPVVPLNPTVYGKTLPQPLPPGPTNVPLVPVGPPNPADPDPSEVQ